MASETNLEEATLISGCVIPVPIFKKAAKIHPEKYRDVLFITTQKFPAKIILNDLQPYTRVMKSKNFAKTDLRQMLFRIIYHLFY